MRLAVRERSSHKPIHPHSPPGASLQFPGAIDSSRNQVTESDPECYSRCSAQRTRCVAAEAS